MTTACAANPTADGSAIDMAESPGVREPAIGEDKGLPPRFAR